MTASPACYTTPGQALIVLSSIVTPATISLRQSVSHSVLEAKKSPTSDPLPERTVGFGYLLRLIGEDCALQFVTYRRKQILSDIQMLLCTYMNTEEVRKYDFGAPLELRSSETSNSFISPREH